MHHVTLQGGAPTHEVLPSRLRCMCGTQEAVLSDLEFLVCSHCDLASVLGVIQG